MIESGGYAGTMTEAQIERKRMDDGVGLVIVQGEHDLYTAPDLQRHLVEELAHSGIVVVDLTATSFVDSSIIGVLLETRQTASRDLKGFAVCLGDEADPSVQRIFEITGLTETLPVAGDREAARTAASAGRTPAG
jgi:anti-sigma B factor antagonist